MDMQRLKFAGAPSHYAAAQYLLANMNKQANPTGEVPASTPKAESNPVSDVLSFLKDNQVTKGIDGVQSAITDYAATSPLAIGTLLGAGVGGITGLGSGLLDKRKGRKNHAISRMLLGALFGGVAGTGIRHFSSPFRVHGAEKPSVPGESTSTAQAPANSNVKPALNTESLAARAILNKRVGEAFKTISKPASNSVATTDLEFKKGLEAAYRAASKTAFDKRAEEPVSLAPRYYSHQPTPKFVLDPKKFDGKSVRQIMDEVKLKDRQPSFIESNAVGGTLMGGGAALGAGTGYGIGTGVGRAITANRPEAHVVKNYVFGTSKPSDHSKPYRNLVHQLKTLGFDGNEAENNASKFLADQANLRRPGATKTPSVLQFLESVGIGRHTLVSGGHPDALTVASHQPIANPEIARKQMSILGKLIDTPALRQLIGADADQLLDTNEFRRLSNLGILQDAANDQVGALKTVMNNYDVDKKVADKLTGSLPSKNAFKQIVNFFNPSSNLPNLPKGLASLNVKNLTQMVQSANPDLTPSQVAQQVENLENIYNNLLKGNIANGQFQIADKELGLLDKLKNLLGGRQLNQTGIAAIAQEAKPESRALSFLGRWPFGSVTHGQLEGAKAVSPSGRSWLSLMARNPKAWLASSLAAGGAYAGNRLWNSLSAEDLAKQRQAAIQKYVVNLNQPRNKS